MISTPTVLVLGAGASQSYGFPLGRKLKNQVCSQLRRGPNKVVMEEMGFSDAAMNEFIDHLRHSAYSSVDAFLEVNPQHLNVGKAAIATMLIPCENKDTLFPPGGPSEDWYEFLVNRLGVGVADFRENKLSVITYNYDRSLEEYVSTVAQYREMSPADLKHLEIIHVHGCLGVHPFFDGAGQVREYSPELEAEAIRQAADGIRILHEAQDDAPEFQRAQEVLRKMLEQETSRIYFLGFGYDPTNVQRLKIFNQPWPEKQRSDVTVAGTKVGILPNEWAQVQRIFNDNIQIIGEGHEIHNFLRGFAPLD